MSTAPQPTSSPVTKDRRQPFRRAILRGLGVVLPPLLTIVVFLWAWTVIESYVLVPVEGAANRVLAFALSGDILRDVPAGVRADDFLVRHDGDVVSVQELLGTVPPPDQIPERVAGRGGQIVSLRYQDTIYVPLASREWIPAHVYETVRANSGGMMLSSATARDFYDRYVQIRYLRRTLVIPVFLIIFVAILYVIGLSFAAGMGRFLWNSLEAVIQRVPIIRNVYSSVKQVTDFVFSEREIQFNRVVAVEYPRKGVWSIGFVTGDGLLDISSAANQPVVSVLIPNSPVPATGYTITVLKSETVDLNISVDQAIQFIVSCGVVVPAHQQYIRDEVTQQIRAAMSEQGHNGDSAGSVTGHRAPAAEEP